MLFGLVVVNKLASLPSKELLKLFVVLVCSVAAVFVLTSLFPNADETLFFA
jgi:hypothetical protein